jgi:type IV pilus assembly protein PilO
MQRILIGCSTFIVLIGLFVWLSYLPKYEEIDRLKQEYQKAEKRLIEARQNAVKLTEYRNKREEAKEKFEIAKKALPAKQEIPSLLTNISQSGMDSGLEFLLFQPGSERPHEFYAAIPVSIKVAGSYHSVALFFDKVSKLSRIVNIENIKMKMPRGKNKLETTCTAVTYKFIEASPEEKK